MSAKQLRILMGIKINSKQALPGITTKNTGCFCQRLPTIILQKNHYNILCYSLFLVR
jgi:hypothetical protein